jgi:hypothetical protein
MMDKRLACQDKVADSLVLQKCYTEQLLENKGLVAENQGYKRTIATQSEVIDHMERAVKSHSGIIELSKKARNPKRATGGKRGRPLGSKSRAVGFGADAMPDHDVVHFGAIAEVAAALM